MLASEAWKASGEGSAHNRIVTAIERAILEEREACAVTALKHLKGPVEPLVSDIARDIRARA